MGTLFNLLNRSNTMNSTRNLSIWNDLRPYSIGFDDIFRHFDLHLDSKSTTFPPYNMAGIIPSDRNLFVEPVVKFSLFVAFKLLIKLSKAYITHDLP